MNLFEIPGFITIGAIITLLAVGTTVGFKYRPKTEYIKKFSILSKGETAFW